MKKVAVLVGDLVDSREAENRKQVQFRLQAALDVINDKFSETSLAVAEIVLGDELEGVFEEPATCLKAFQQLEVEIFPARIRGGIGTGKISTGITESVSLMDGPAFHRARSAVQKAKEVGTHLVVNTGHSRKDQLINVVFNLIGAIRDDWTKRQWEIINYCRSQQPETQKKIAETFGVSQPAITKILTRAHFRKVEEANEVVSQRLNELI